MSGQRRGREEEAPAQIVRPVLWQAQIDREPTIVSDAGNNRRGEIAELLHAKVKAEWAHRASGLCTQVLEGDRRLDKQMLNRKNRLLDKMPRERDMPEDAAAEAIVGVPSGHLVHCHHPLDDAADKFGLLAQPFHSVVIEDSLEAVHTAASINVCVELAVQILDRL